MITECQVSSNAVHTDNHVDAGGTKGDDGNAGQDGQNVGAGVVVGSVRQGGHSKGAGVAVDSGRQGGQNVGAGVAVGSVSQGGHSKGAGVAVGRVRQGGQNKVAGVTACNGRSVRCNLVVANGKGARAAQNAGDSSRD